MGEIAIEAQTELLYLAVEFKSIGLVEMKIDEEVDLLVRFEGVRLNLQRLGNLIMRS